MKKKKQKKEKLSFFDILKIIGKVISAIISIIFILIFIFFILSFFGVFRGVEIETGNVALIQINGFITTTGDYYVGKMTKSDDVLKLIKQAEEDDGIKAILFEINSPGGGPVASDEIGSAIKRAEKPTVSLIREVGASGAFWIATAADKVYANRMSITGSIGVNSAGLGLEELIKNYNVTYRKLVSGEHKDAGTMWRGLTPIEKEMFLGKLKKVHEDFIRAVAENRDMKYEDVKKHADGFFFLGKEALEFGFVDELGDKESVKKYLEETLEIDVDFKKLSVKKGFAEMLGGIISEQSFNVGKGISSQIISDEKPKLQV